MAELEDLNEILRSNLGFPEGRTSDWAEYARSHGFKRVKAIKVARCPDCSGAPRRRALGQYVYYSSLIHLLDCCDCGLIWADGHIDPNTVRAHFEVTYKDEEYFNVSRQPIFKQLAHIIDDLTPTGGRVLDIGGAHGDLMANVVARRPDLDVVVNDISHSATRRATEKFGFATLTGDAHELARHHGRYDVAVLSDILYYEPNLRLLWTAISKLVSPQGSIVIRIPNKYRLIQLAQSWRRFAQSKREQRMQDRIPFFNPEHIFVFRQSYLRHRLAGLGFRRVTALPSPPLKTEG